MHQTENQSSLNILSVTIFCIYHRRLQCCSWLALKYWGKHKRKMEIGGINWQESNQQQWSSLDEFTLLLLGCTIIIWDEWTTIIRLWWLSQWLVTYGHHLDDPLFSCGAISRPPQKAFVIVHLHCIVSNLRKISQLSTLPLEKILRAPLGTMSHNFGAGAVSRDSILSPRSLLSSHWFF